MTPSHCPKDRESFRKLTLIVFALPPACLTQFIDESPDMPLVRQKWEDIPERERFNDYLDEAAFEFCQNELEALIESRKESLAPKEFAEWIELMRQGGVEWTD